MGMMMASTNMDKTKTLCLDMMTLVMLIQKTICGTMQNMMNT